MPVKEYQIVEHFLGPSLKDEVMKIMPVQKQTRAGQRTRFKVGGMGWIGIRAGDIGMLPWTCDMESTAVSHARPKPQRSCQK